MGTIRAGFVYGLLALVLLGSSVKPVIIVHPDDVMDSPLPKAAAVNWQNAPGRERIALRVPGGVLRGYRYAGKMSAAPTLLVFGGSGNIIQRHDQAMRGFARFASSVEWYDYRGYGYSTGTAHFDALQTDALRMFNASAKRAGGPGHVVVLGYSMGTAIADYVALRRHVGGLILAAPWSNYVTTAQYTDAKHAYRLTPAAAKDFDQIAMVRLIRVPLLVFQGTKDDQIPPSQGREVELAAVSNDKRFVAIPGAKHSWLLENAYAQSAVHAFLHKLGK